MGASQTAAPVAVTSLRSVYGMSEPQATTRALVRNDTGTVHDLFADGQLSIAEGSPPHIRRAVERYVEQSLADDLADIWAHYMKPPGSHFWVAERHGCIVGIAGIEPGESGVAEVRRLAVARHARRCGIARSLLETAETWARTRGYVAMKATTTHLQAAAVALYESAGFRARGVGTWGPLRLVHLQKQLVDADHANAHGKT